MLRRLIISRRAEPVNEYRNLNFLDALHRVSLSIFRKAEFTLKGSLLLASAFGGIKGGEYERRTATMKVPFGKIEYRRAP